MHLIERNGAPSGKKNFVFYNPPVVNKPLNIRQSAATVVNQLAKTFLKEKIQTIVFARSRVRVEVILSHIQELVKKRSAQNQFVDIAEAIYQKSGASLKKD